MHKSHQRLILTILVIAALLLVWWLLFPSKQDVAIEKTSTQTSQNELLKKASSFDHAHGIAVDRGNPDNVYIATHNGLYLLKTGSNTELFSVGSNRDDFMGFTAHPTDITTFYSSGHPRYGGNIGFQKSTDSGKTWQKVSDGLEGPVDFHTMTLSLANPDIVYGYYHGKLQRSLDGGKTWEAFTLPFVPIGFATVKSDANVIYAASPQGAFISNDQGKTWRPFADVAKTGSTSALAISSGRLVLFSEKLGMAITDSENQLVSTKAELSGAMPLYTDFSPTQTQVGYFITETHAIFKTTDGGQSWDKIY